jgi:tetrahydromethanopterin S-methyltransferase subunit G
MRTTQEETMMAFLALLSELYETFRRKVGADKRPARVVPEPSWWHRSRAASTPKAVIEDTRFRRIDEKFDALSRAMDQRFGEFGQVMGERFDALGRMIDDRFAGVDQQFVARDARLARLETKTAQIAEMDVWLKRLETKTATEFRYLRWGLGIVIALVLGLVTKAILDWLMPLFA